MNKTVTMPIAVGLAVVFAAAGFYAGVQYQKKQFGVNGAGQPGQFAQFGGRNGSGQGRNAQNRGGFVNGDILKQDAESLTISVQGGGSKTVYLSASSSVGKFVEGSASDLKVGERVTVNGTPNADGSIVAQMIQIRPAGSPDFRGGPGGPSRTPNGGQPAGPSQ
jgi:hypothetical protein